MKKHLLMTAMMVAALVILGSCHHSGNTPDPDPGPDPDVPVPNQNEQSPWLSVNVRPEWDIDWSSNDPRPDWVDPDVSIYESWMIIMVKVPEPIVPFVSNDDMMAVFINDEIRGLSSVATAINENEDDDKENTYFIVKTYGNASSKGEQFSIRYYCSQLHQLFVVDEEEKFVPEGDLGVSHDYVPPLLLGSSKYPVVMFWSLRLNIDQEQEEPIEPDPGDLLAAFVGGECRGTTILGGKLFDSYANITVYSKQEGEKITLRYYSTKKEAIRIINTNVTTKSGSKQTQISI